MAEPETTERVEGPTPNGGAYAIVYYQAADGAPVPKSEAVRGEAFEYTADGKPLGITFLDWTGADDEFDEDDDSTDD